MFGILPVHVQLETNLFINQRFSISIIFSTSHQFKNIRWTNLWKKRKKIELISMKMKGNFEKKKEKIKLLNNR